MSMQPSSLTHKIRHNHLLLSICSWQLFHNDESSRGPVINPDSNPISNCRFTYIFFTLMHSFLPYVFLILFYFINSICYSPAPFTNFGFLFSIINWLMHLWTTFRYRNELFFYSWWWIILFYYCSISVQNLSKQ